MAHSCARDLEITPCASGTSSQGNVYRETPSHVTWLESLYKPLHQQIFSTDMFLILNINVFYHSVFQVTHLCWVPDSTSIVQTSEDKTTRLDGHRVIIQELSLRYCINSFKPALNIVVAFLI